MAWIIFILCGNIVPAFSLAMAAIFWAYKLKGRGKILASSLITTIINIIYIIIVLVEVDVSRDPQSPITLMWLVLLANPMAFYFNIVIYLMMCAIEWLCSTRHPLT